MLFEDKHFQHEVVTRMSTFLGNCAIDYVIRILKSNILLCATWCHLNVYPVKQKINFLILQDI
jgi:hypothetical protein